MANNVTREEMFRIRPYDLKQIGAHGSGRIEVEVHGYWSEVASLYIDRACKWSREDQTEDFEWTITQSHSSGGREAKEQPNDLIAERCFAHAIIALSDLGVVLMEKTGEFEVAYQARREQDRAARAVEEAKKQALIAADKPLGDNGAKALVSMLEARARQVLWTMQSYHVLNRGSDKGFTIDAKCSGDRITFYSKGSVISRKMLVSELAVSSHRSALPKEV